MRHVDGGDAQLLLELADLGADLDADLRVEIGQRLVQQQDVGVQNQRPRQGHALLLPSRELPGVAVLEAHQVHLAEPLGEPGGDLPGGELAELETVGDVGGRRHVGPERVVLEDHADIAVVGGQPVHHPVAEADLAGIGLREAGQQPEQRGLPAPRGTEQREQLAVGHDEIGMVDGGDGAEALDEPGDDDLHGLRFGPALPLTSSSARPTWPRCPSEILS